MYLIDDICKYTSMHSMDMPTHILAYALVTLPTADRSDTNTIHITDSAKSTQYFRNSGV